jgi:hypothetical protein
MLSLSGERDNQKREKETFCSSFFFTLSRIFIKKKEGKLGDGTED